MYSYHHREKARGHSVAYSAQCSLPVYESWRRRCDDGLQVPYSYCGISTTAVVLRISEVTLIDDIGMDKPIISPTAKPDDVEFLHCWNRSGGLCPPVHVAYGAASA